MPGRSATGLPEPQLQSPVPPLQGLSSNAKTSTHDGTGSARMGVKVGNVRVSLSSKGKVLSAQSPRSSARPDSARSGGILSMLTPRATPREPELQTTHCFLVLSEPYNGETSTVVNKYGQSMLGLTLEGATVESVETIGPMADFARYCLKAGDVIKKIGERDFESSKPIHEYLVPGRQALKCIVERWVTPSKYPLSARVASMFDSTEMPDTAADMEMIIQEWDLVRENPSLLSMGHAGMGPMGMGGMAGVGAMGMGGIHGIARGMRFGMGGF